VVFFFFFQAEDGIRDWSVTGVQTCALPIFLDVGHISVGHAAELHAVDRDPVDREDDLLLRQPHHQRAVGMILADIVELERGATRSEERRVGKEWRSRWWPEH